MLSAMRPRQRAAGRAATSISGPSGRGERRWSHEPHHSAASVVASGVLGDLTDEGGLPAAGFGGDEGDLTPPAGGDPLQRGGELAQVVVTLEQHGAGLPPLCRVDGPCDRDISSWLAHALSM